MDWFIQQYMQTSDTMQLDEMVRKLAEGLGADLFGVADITSARDFILSQSDPDVAVYPRAISIGIALLHPIVDQLPKRDNRNAAASYKHHAYDVVNRQLDLITLRLSCILQHEGYSALPVPASGRLAGEEIRAFFSHKLAAHLAGLGWIGKSCLLITQEAGPRVRWATVLTDAPLKAAVQRLDDLCGNCQECVQVCPIGALNGRPFREDEPREARFDARKCDNYLKELERTTGVGVCGMCMYICPYGRHKSNR
jgi:epoxyqueuosine reductase